MVGARIRAVLLRFARSPSSWLAVAVALSAVVTFVLANVRLVELDLTTWDFGIYQQALWSAAHGGPFYEAADWETGGFGSFLQVHSAFILYLLAPVYRAAPSPEVLLGAQSIVVALAAVPLYLLARDLSGSGRRALVAAVLFLIWAPTLGASLYDFHIESFLPLELFTIALLFQRRSYAAGLGIAVVSFATMEFAPVITFALAVFFGWPTEAQLRRGWDAVRAGRGSVVPAGRAALRDRRLVASFTLAAASVAAYYLLLSLRTKLLASSFGFPAFPTANSGYVIGATPDSLGISFGNLSVGLLTKVGLWLLVYALVGFLPVLAPRSFVIAVPVVLFTSLTANLNYSTVGFQYGFLYAIPVFLGVAYALPKVSRANLPLLFRNPGPPPAAPRPRWRRVVRRPSGLIVGLGVVIALNLAIGPLDPMVQGADGFGSGYRLSYNIPPGYGDAVRVADLVPAHSTVVATDDLFPLVANLPTSYSFIWIGRDFTLNLPFSPTHLPEAVLVAQNRYYTVTPWLADVLYNTSDFGARGVAWSTPAGVVVLFLAHYSGPMASFGPAPPVRAEFGPGPIAQGGPAQLGPAPGGPYRTEIESEPLNEGLVFSGPWTNLGPGNYTFTLGLRAWAVDPANPPPAGEGVVYINGDAFGTPEFLGKHIAFRTLSGGGWYNFTFAVVATGPLFDLCVRGYSSSMTAVVAVDYLVISPSG
ncbi:MAG TPA: DUF2079 domain-containing protein [Thermoplasmata archaeon]|nr:DUF2079 domain-containing protein [Thermoplasmata archaeon]